ncbi:hypothetical protein AVEN_17359-1 [Araneus ventricosus]|uniref:Uncharacterized protein n=1 Tax=Araneus ventricosus TaxID=182803 RepID=A0A4Y1ZPU0_ARAVE|nr:hypothetical protein AVEN_17359-1 [Araneus ventricosus]
MRVPGSKPDSTEDLLCMWAKSYTVGQTRWNDPDAWTAGPIQKSSSPSDGSLKLRGPSQNIPRVASEQDFYCAGTKRKCPVPSNWENFLSSSKVNDFTFTYKIDHGSSIGDSHQRGTTSSDPIPLGGGSQRFTTR